MVSTSRVNATCSLVNIVVCSVFLSGVLGVFVFCKVILWYVVCDEGGLRVELAVWWMCCVVGLKGFSCSLGLRLLWVLAP